MSAVVRHDCPLEISLGLNAHDGCGLIHEALTVSYRPLLAVNMPTASSTMANAPAQLDLGERIACSLVCRPSNCA
jgi:hypothetical protein